MPMDKKKLFLIIGVDIIITIAIVVYFVFFHNK